MREEPAPLPGWPGRGAAARGVPSEGEGARSGTGAGSASPAGRWRPPGRSSGQCRGRGRPPARRAPPIPLLPPGCGGSRCYDLLFLSFSPPQASAALLLKAAGLCRLWRGSAVPGLRGEGTAPGSAEPRRRRPERGGAGRGAGGSRCRPSCPNSAAPP